MATEEDEAQNPGKFYYLDLPGMADTNATTLTVLYECGGSPDAGPFSDVFGVIESPNANGPVLFFISDFETSFWPAWPPGTIFLEENQVLYDATMYLGPTLRAAGYKAMFQVDSGPPLCSAGGPYVAECTGAGTSVPLDGSGSRSDSCSPLTLTWTGPFAGGTATGVQPTVEFPGTGTFTVDLSVSDGATTTTCSTTVIVRDTTPPAIFCPARGAVPTDLDRCDAMIAFGFLVSAFDSCDASPVVVCVPPSGSIFPKGDTTVTCTATDASLNSASCSFTMTVVDTQPPGITCPDIVQPTDPDQCSAVVNFVPTATDNCPGVAVVCLPPSGSVFPKGPTTVNCTATDASLNTSGCSFTVTVVDQQPPVITCPPNETVEFTSIAGAIVDYPDPVVTDNCSAVTFVCTPPAGSVFPIGTATVNCTATDSSGNSSACSFTTTVLGALGVKMDVLEDLIALRATLPDKTPPGKKPAPGKKPTPVGSKDAQKLDEAIDKLQSSIAPELWVDQTHVQAKQGEHVFQLEKETVQKLQELINDKHSTIPAATLQGFIARIVKCDRLLAKVAIADAIAASGNSKKINEANHQAFEGDMDILHHQYEGIDDYRGAWHKALDAVK